MEPELEGRPSAATSEGTGHPEGVPFTKWTFIAGCRCARCTASFKRSKLHAPMPDVDPYGRPYTGSLPHDPHLGTWLAGCRCMECAKDA